VGERIAELLAAQLGGKKTKPEHEILPVELVNGSAKHD
jgi:DNA-binding LacI/PurR family transcriptional regulator